MHPSVETIDPVSRGDQERSGLRVLRGWMAWVECTSLTWKPSKADWFGRLGLHSMITSRMTRLVLYNVQSDPASVS